MEQGVKAIRKYALNAFECVRMRLNTHRDAVLGQLLAHLRLEPTDHIDFSAIHRELPGAEELTNEQEEEGEEEDDDDTLLEELDQIIVSGGKTSQEIKEMPYLEKKMHAQQCDKNRNIKAKDIGNIATKMGCPEEKTTKIAKLMWICTEYLHDPHAYN